MTAVSMNHHGSGKLNRGLIETKSTTINEFVCSVTFPQQDGFVEKAPSDTPAGWKGSANLTSSSHFYSIAEV